VTGLRSAAERGAIASRRPADDVLDDGVVVALDALASARRSERRTLRRNTESGT